MCCIHFALFDHTEMINMLQALAVIGKRDFLLALYAMYTHLFLANALS